MKHYNQNTPLKSLFAATAGLGFIAAPLAFAQGSNKPPYTPSNTQENTQGTTQERTVVKVDRTPLKSEVTDQFVEGYTIPDQYRTYFTAFPEVEEKDVVVRYQKGRAYHVNSKDWKIVRVVDLDSSIEIEKEDSALVRGYVIPEDRRTRFISVPKAEKEQRVHYFNNTAYYTNSDFEIVRTVRLTR